MEQGVKYPVVYILREQMLKDSSGVMSPMDYSPARAFGEPTIVTSVEADDVTEGSRMVKMMVDDLRSMADNYRPDTDYIVPTGAPTMILLAGMLLKEAGHHKVQLLKWNRRQATYRKVIWDLQEIV